MSNSLLILKMYKHVEVFTYIYLFIYFSLHRNTVT